MGRTALVFTDNMIVDSELESRINPEKINVGAYNVKQILKGTEVVEADFLDHNPKFGEPKCFPRKGVDLFNYFRNNTTLLSDVEFQNVEVAVPKAPTYEETTGKIPFYGRKKSKGGLS